MRQRTDISLEAAGRNKHSSAALRIAAQTCGLRGAALINERDRRAMAARRIVVALLKFDLGYNNEAVAEMLGLPVAVVEDYSKDHSHECLSHVTRFDRVAGYRIGPNYIPRYLEAQEALSSYFET